MRVLLTGIGGFIGSHCLEYWLQNTDWEIIGIDSFRNKGSTVRYYESTPLQYHNRVKVFTHDLAVPIDRPLENLLLDRKVDNKGIVISRNIDVIVNMASDSAVERSTSDPTYCLRNNYELVINMLELSRRIKPKLFVQISTDEVYGEAAPKPFTGHKEWSEIIPSNPYAASKAAQESVAISYWRTYNVPLLITNCMNVIGERQDPEKFLPKIIQYVIQNKIVPIYAETMENIGSRVYLDVLNKADALMYLIDNYTEGGVPLPMYGQGKNKPARYNICGETELNNLELAQKVASILKKQLYYKFISSDFIRPGYDRRYALDGEKLKQFGWKPKYSFDETLERIVKWTLKNYHWLM